MTVASARRIGLRTTEGNYISDPTSSLCSAFEPCVQWHPPGEFAPALTRRGQGREELKPLNSIGPEPVVSARVRMGQIQEDVEIPLLPFSERPDL